MPSVSELDSPRASSPRAPDQADEAAAPVAPAAEPSVDEARLMAPSYDGIRMYDYPPPAWWQMLLAAMIIFAGSYGLYFHVFHAGATPEARYGAALARYEATKATREAREAGEVSEFTLAEAAGKPAVVARGSALFASHCASCHQADGRGLSGPNLTDDYQIHGSTRIDLYDTIRNGVPWTAMPPWGGQLHAADLVAVTAYAISLRGTHVSGRPPQGPRVGAFLPPVRQQ
jgi:cytochrome c oxidase cbb3-type subunit 3